MGNILAEDASPARPGEDGPGAAMSDRAWKRKAHVDDGKVGLGVYRVDKETKDRFDALAMLRGKKPGDYVAALMVKELGAHSPATEVVQGQDGAAN